VLAATISAGNQCKEKQRKKERRGRYRPDALAARGLPERGFDDGAVGAMGHRASSFSSIESRPGVSRVRQRHDIFFLPCAYHTHYSDRIPDLPVREI
jgi:hypothetical protein